MTRLQVKAFVFQLLGFAVLFIISRILFEKYSNLNNKLIIYNAIDQNLHQLKAALIEGYPVLCGVNIYSNFETDDVKETGNIKLPNKDDNLVGGLAITLVGFDEGDKVFIAKNSWGAEWGDNGYCYIPYDYILDPKLSSDFWIIRKTYENKETEF